MLYDSGNSDRGSGEGWDGEGCGSDVQEGGDIGVPVADSCRCLTETNTILYSTYPSIKTLKKIEITTRDMKKELPLPLYPLAVGNEGASPSPGSM